MRTRRNIRQLSPEDEVDVINKYGLNLCHFNKCTLYKFETIQHHFTCKLVSISINTNRKLILSLLNVEEMKYTIFLLKVKLYFRLKNLSKCTKFVKYIPSLIIINRLTKFKNDEETYEISNYSSKILKKHLLIKRKDHM